MNYTELCPQSVLSQSRIPARLRSDIRKSTTRDPAMTSCNVEFPFEPWKRTVRAFVLCHTHVRICSNSRTYASSRNYCVAKRHEESCVPLGAEGLLSLKLVSVLSFVRANRKPIFGMLLCKYIYGGKTYAGTWLIHRLHSLRTLPVFVYACWCIRVRVYLNLDASRRLIIVFKGFLPITFPWPAEQTVWPCLLYNIWNFHQE